ncbi:DUF2000 domain-containing protein [Spiractinospora alimapuensis]|uniref:DUF2000 domain-containing protein n=1 Tax=Spiractinospora alimapuensis TaxID=2820884 RepID=UPI001F30A2E5|nr:DUF2000 domain-containing protein [Spiractinospora alimapuensis]QVQ53691.1 DUF2000 domain-containing protein [Spiractinospora alimapuensis]
MRTETKIGIVVREDLATWQKLNVTAFLAGGLAGGVEGLTGQPYVDGGGTEYTPMISQPVLVYTGEGGALTRVRDRATARSLTVGIYTEELFATNNDIDNRAAVVAVDTEKLQLVGVSVYGPRNQVSAALKGLALHG